MHGRLKVRTTEEQAEAKRKEKEKKVKLYRKTTERIFAKRDLGEKDDELLKLTMEIVLENSDLSTMWIIRREIIESRLQSLVDKDIIDLCLNELTLMERCLRVNPKAYCVWLHRQWIMNHTPLPDWKKEKVLCDLFLTHDERNFHCWDYRRYVINKADTSIEDEFKFTTDKIAINFSNYSAWHYRSKLLPKMIESSDGSINDLDEEYDMAHNAFYTDPADQSPWFYHKWLLGRGEKPLVLGCGFLKRNPSPSITVAYNQPIKPNKSDPIIVFVNGDIVTKIVESDWPKRLWSCDLSIANEETVTVKVEYKNSTVELAMEPGMAEGVWFIGDLSKMFIETITNVSLNVLQSELKTCQELLQLEPDNKWCVLTTLQLLEAIDPIKGHDEILNLFDKLVIIDPYRKGYYNDLRSRHVIGYELFKYLSDFKLDKLLNLSNKGLTRLYYSEYMMICQHIDLHGNSIRSFEEDHFKNLMTLNISDNNFGKTPKGLLSLTSLNIDNNGINDIDVLVTLGSLKHLSIKDNPLTQDSLGVVKTRLPNLDSFEF